MTKKKKSPRTWMLPSPSQRTPKAALPEKTKADVDAKAKKLVAILKPKYVQPPPKKPEINYIIDVWTKWIGSTLYFGLTYACPSNAIFAVVRGQIRSNGACWRRQLRPFLHAAQRQVVQAVPKSDGRRVP